MKTFILKIVLFFFILFGIDRGLGLVCDYMNAHLTGGDKRNHYDVFNRVKADILILGSSRANHHYNPQIVTDSLKMSCYNCGYDGFGILSMYGRYEMILQRHKPKVVIYDVLAANEIYGDESDHLKFMAELKPYIGHPQIMSVFSDVSPMEKYKLYSRMYQYNSVIFDLVKDFFSHPIKIENGYSPLSGVMNYEPHAFTEDFATATPDSVKLRYVIKLIESTKQNNIQLVFALSPFYNATNSNDYRVIKDLCRQYDVPLIDCYTDSTFMKKEYFQDSYHLNGKGADKFTSSFVHRLKTYL